MPAQPAARRHGLRPLRADRKLGKAALGHSKDMVAHRYFAHESRSGAPFTARIARTGWTRARRHYILGENIGWGSGSLATPRSMVRGWMQSAPHRANILERRFHMIGIGVAFGSPGRRRRRDLLHGLRRLIVRNFRTLQLLPMS